MGVVDEGITLKVLCTANILILQFFGFVFSVGV